MVVSMLYHTGKTGNKIEWEVKMFTDPQLVYFHSAVMRTYGTLSKLAGVTLQLKDGDAMGNPLPDAVKANLEAQAIVKFSELAQAFAGLSQAIAALQIGDSSLIDLIIPPIPSIPTP